MNCEKQRAPESDQRSPCALRSKIGGDSSLRHRRNLPDPRFCSRSFHVVDKFLGGTLPERGNFSETFDELRFAMGPPAASRLFRNATTR